MGYFDDIPDKSGGGVATAQAAPDYFHDIPGAGKGPSPSSDYFADIPTPPPPSPTPATDAAASEIPGGPQVLSPAEEKAAVINAPQWAQELARPAVSAGKLLAGQIPTSVAAIKAMVPMVTGTGGAGLGGFVGEAAKMGVGLAANMQTARTTQPFTQQWWDAVMPVAMAGLQEAGIGLHAVLPEKVAKPPVQTEAPPVQVKPPPVPGSPEYNVRYQQPTEGGVPLAKEEKVSHEAAPQAGVRVLEPSASPESLQITTADILGKRQRATVEATNEAIAQAKAELEAAGRAQGPIPGTAPPEAAPATVRLYHSTPKEFGAFAPENATPTGLGGKAHYFSDKPEPAYGEKVVPVDVPQDRIANLAEIEKNPEFQQGGNIDELLQKKGYAGTYNSSTGEYTLYNPNEFRAEPAPPAAAEAPTVEAPSKGMTEGEARAQYDLAVKEAAYTPEKMAQARGMSEAYQKAYPYAAEYAIKNAKAVADIPFDEHLRKLEASGQLLPEAPPRVAEPPLGGAPPKEAPPTPAPEFSGVAGAEPEGPIANLPPAETPGTQPPPVSGINNDRLAQIYGPDAVVAGKGRSAQAWKQIGQADPRDPYVVLDNARQQGIAPPADVALLRTEHQRLLNDARNAYGTPFYNELAQRAVDMANAIKGVAHGPASDVFRVLQEQDIPRYESPADFDNIVRERMNREATPTEKATFQKMTDEIRNGNGEAVKTASDAQQKLRQSRPRAAKEPMKFADAADYIRKQIKELTIDCAL